MRIVNRDTKEVIEAKIDEILSQGKKFSTVPLILPADGASYRYDYRGFSVRYWKDPVHGVDRYDFAIAYGR